MRTIVKGATFFPAVLALAACGGEETETEAPATEVVAEDEETASAVALADLTGDAEAGEAVFAQCRTCHQVEEGRNGIGPSLYGVIGREAGSVEGFNYSPANANAGLTWTPEAMFEYIAAPRDYMPGTRMAFPGLQSAQDRADLIAYLDATDE